MKFGFSAIQQLGRALMLPIAVLPAAALLLRFGQSDLLNLPFMAAAGAAIFENLGLLFAIGIAVGFANANNGAAGLAGVVGYFVIVKGASVLMEIPPEIAADNAAKVMFLAQAASRMSIPVGIVAGLSAGILYNRFYLVKLPDYLSFFGGKRFIPIVTGFLCLGWAFIFGEAWPILSSGLDTFSLLISASGDFGLFLYGLLNRLLLITGLHHILNNVVWFLHGSFTVVQDGIPTVITGDLNRFLRDDPTAGAFMAGFFPVMMFGLPAACLAMYRNALPGKHFAVSGLLISMALTAFLTGITEPIEFSFMFLAPALYVIHAVLTGLSMVIMNVLDIKLGFGFSAGFIDYVINFNKATNPLYLIPVGAVYFAVYYLIFSFAIRFFNLKTMGREDPADSAVSDSAVGVAVDSEGELAKTVKATLMTSASTTSASPVTVGLAGGSATGGSATGGLAGKSPKGKSPAQNVQEMITALGGVENILSLDSCSTRLCLTMKDTASAVDQDALRGLGAFGFSRPEKGSLQVVFGPTASFVAAEVHRALAPFAEEAGSLQNGTAGAAQVKGATESVKGGSRIGDMIIALGGPDNLKSVDACATRLRLIVGDNRIIDEAALTRLGAVGIIRPDENSLQVVLGPVADTTATEITEMLASLDSQPKSEK